MNKKGEFKKIIEMNNLEIARILANFERHLSELRKDFNEIQREAQFRIAEKRADKK